MQEQNHIKIIEYTPKNEKQLFALIQREGDEWTYWQGNNWAKYQKALTTSVTYLIFVNDVLCGYVRCRDDSGFGVYVFDLLVDKNHRGNNYGRLLLEHLYLRFQNDPVYVLGDVYPYYEDKLGYEIEGKVYVVKQKDPCIL